MRELAIHELVIDDPAAWGKWPWTQDKNYDDLMSQVSVGEYLLDADTLLRVHQHCYPIASAYIRAGIEKLPEGLGPGGIDVRCKPPAVVLEEQLKHLREMAKICQVVRWRHFYHCQPIVAAQLKSIFKLSIFEFSDDCLGSSEIKSFPNAPFFDAGLCYMFVWDGVSGEKTTDKYTSLGTGQIELAFNGYSGGTLEYCQKHGLSAYERAPRLKAGWRPPIWMGFVGARSCMGFREEFSTRLIEIAEHHPKPIKLYGHRFPNGELGTRNQQNEGALCCELYRDTLFGPNYPCSGMTNVRLFDLWHVGVAQLVFDRHNELLHFGLHPGEHYIPFNGSAADCISAAEHAEKDMNGLADMIVRAQQQGDKVAQEHTTARALARIYGRHLDRLVG